jgi:hypothetical protein
MKSVHVGLDFQSSLPIGAAGHKRCEENVTVEKIRNSMESALVSVSER